MFVSDTGITCVCVGILWRDPAVRIRVVLNFVEFYICVFVMEICAFFFVTFAVQVKVGRKGKALFRGRVLDPYPGRLCSDSTLILFIFFHFHDSISTDFSEFFSRDDKKIRMKFLLNVKEIGLFLF